jgi:hypothetical protein
MSKEENLFIVDQEVNDLAIGYIFGVDIGIPGRSIDPDTFSESKFPGDALDNFLDKYIYNNPYSPYNHNMENLENPFIPITPSKE